MNRTTRRSLSAAFVGVLIWLTTPLSAQLVPGTGETPVKDVAATPELSLTEVEAALAAVEADARIEDAEKAALRSAYKQAVEAVKEAAEFRARAVEYRDAIKTVPEKAAGLRAQLKALPTAERAAVVAPAISADDLRREIDARRADLGELSDRLSATTSELARLEGRPGEISARLPEAQGELSAVRRELASPRQAEDTSSPGQVRGAHLAPGQGVEVAR